MGHSQSHSNSKDPHSRSNGKSKSPEQLNQNQDHVNSDQTNSSAPATDKSAIATLSSRQKFLVRQTWEIARQDLERVGFTTFAEIFEKHQSLRDVFLESWKVSEDDLALDDRLTSHGLRVTNIINQVVDSLEDLDEVNKMLAGLGKRHVHYKVSAEMVPVIGITFIHSFRPLLEAEDLWTSEIEECWNIIIDHVTGTIIKFLVDSASKIETVPNSENDQSS